MTEIDSYLSKVKPGERTELERVRKIIKEFAPNAIECISYKLPAFKVNNQPLIYFGVYSNHLSLFPTSRPIKVLKDKLSEYKTTTGSIHFTVDKPLPKKLIIELLKIRQEDINKKLVVF